MLKNKGSRERNGVLAGEYGFKKGTFFFLKMRDISVYVYDDGTDPGDRRKLLE